MDNYYILNKINSPADLRGLSSDELDELAAEIRYFLVDKVSNCGGHLASNLGVVELTLALHRVMNTPYDRIIWDVGHQSYVHKIITGRRDRFDTLRRGGGLSGFTNREESEYDCFGAGHSSTSISAAIGFAEAERLRGSDSYTVAVVGDGAFTGGMIHEALNNCDSRLKLIIILNENEMSISKNIGHFATNIAKMRSGKGYLKTKKATRDFVRKIPLIGKWLFRGMRAVKKHFKNLMYGSNYFEDMGLYYLGPVDGHDEAALERLLVEARESGQSTLIHIKTTKGKGYIPAEQNPDLYHSMTPYDAPHIENCFSSVMGDELRKIAAQNDKICAITAAMAEGTGLKDFAADYPDRFFDVGIAEEHALTFAAGLAADGMVPVAAIYSTFLQRGYDSIIHDIALQKLPVVICIDRAGFNSADGATHHGIFDVSFLSAIPGMTIYTPISEGSLRSALRSAVALGAPCAVRYPRGCECREVICRFYQNEQYGEPSIRTDFTPGDSPDVLIITDGRIVKEALTAEKRLAGRVKVGTVLLEMLKPYDITADNVAGVLGENTKTIIFLEEELRNGGMGMLLADVMRRKGLLKGRNIEIMGADDDFVRRTTDEPIYKTAGISADDICDNILKYIG